MKRARFLLLLAFLPAFALAQSEPSSTGGSQDEAPVHLRPPTTGTAEEGLRFSGSLTGVTWQLAELFGDAVAEGIPRPYLVFGASGEVTVHGGCNIMWGDYRTSGADRLVVLRLRATRRDCSAAATIERQINSVLILANAYRIDNGRLTLFQHEMPTRPLAVLETAAGIDTRDLKAGRDKLAAGKQAATREAAARAKKEARKARGAKAKDAKVKTAKAGAGKKRRR